MRSLLDLKQKLLKNELEELYVFTGEETEIRRIYYKKIGEIYGNLKILESVSNLYGELEKRSLFKLKTAYVVYNDMEFLKQKEKVYDRLLKLCSKHVVILVYDEIPENSSFFKYFEEYITVFNKVTDDVAIKYVHKECSKIPSKSLAERIAFNCNNLYGGIKEECNKLDYFINYETKSNNKDDVIDAIRYYYNSLFEDRVIVPTPKEFANAFITKNINELVRQLKILKNENILAYLPELYNTTCLCLYFKLYGKWDGSSIAYNAGEYWGRVKELREMSVIYDKNDLLDIRYLVNKLDIDLRRGTMKAEYAWDYLIGVIL